MFLYHFLASAFIFLNQYNRVHEVLCVLCASPRPPSPNVSRLFFLCFVFTCRVQSKMIKLSIFSYLFRFPLKPFFLKMMKLCRVGRASSFKVDGWREWSGKSVGCTTARWSLQNILVAVHFEKNARWVTQFRVCSSSMPIPFSTLFNSPSYHYRTFVLIYDFIFAHFSFYSFPIFFLLPPSPFFRFGLSRFYVKS